MATARTVLISLIAISAGLTAAAGDAGAQTLDPSSSARYARPIELPLPPGAVGGGVDGGHGVDVLYGAVREPDGSQRPALWQRTSDGRTSDGRSWSVRDLSRGGTITGFATGQDAAGDILVNTGVVLTPRGKVITLPGFDGSSTGVYSRRINARGQIAGGVDATPPQASLGAVWDSPTSTPHPRKPLPVTGAVDAVLLGINDRGETVGNSNIGSDGDFAGGYWPAGSQTGVPLPGLTAHHAFPLLINDSGRIAGWAGNDDGSVGVAAVWNRSGQLINLGTARSSDTAGFYGLSHDGHAAGLSEDATSARVIYWRGRPGDPLRSLLPLSGTWQNGWAGAHYVTDTGFVAGQSIDAAGRHVPVIWPCADRQSFVVPGWYSH